MERSANLRKELALRAGCLPQRLAAWMVATKKHCQRHQDRVTMHISVLVALRQVRTHRCPSVEVPLTTTSSMSPKRMMTYRRVSVGLVVEACEVVETTCAVILTSECYLTLSILCALLVWTPWHCCCH